MTAYRCNWCQEIALGMHICGETEPTEEDKLRAQVKALTEERDKLRADRREMHRRYQKAASAALCIWKHWEDMVRGYERRGRYLSAQLKANVKMKAEVEEARAAVRGVSAENVRLAEEAKKALHDKADIFDNRLRSEIAAWIRRNNSYWSDFSKIEE